MYNVKPYLAEALESVIAQTYRNLEIIVVDDGSTDGCDSICDYYKQMDYRIKVIHQENRGLSAARNTGLDASNGDIIAFLDPDDNYLSEMIEIMVRKMNETLADIVVCSYYVYDSISSTNFSNPIKRYVLNDDMISSEEGLNRIIYGTINVNVWNKLYKRCLFDNLRFDEGHVYEDLILIPLLFERAERIVLIDIPLLRYRKREKSITKTYNDKQALDRLYSWRALERFIIERIPAIFCNQHKRFYQEQILCGIIRYYLNIFSLDDVSSNIKDEFPKEIEMRAQVIRTYSFKTKVLYYSYKVNPYLCLYLRLFNKEIKKSIEWFARRH